MCRWMAWSGQPLLVEELLFKPTHGLIEQSLHSRLGVETTNGDGFGLGWYGGGEGPALYHSIAPAWGDVNLRELASHVDSPHVPRARARDHRDGHPADQLPPVPPRPLAVRAQRGHRGLPADAPGPDAGRRPVAVLRDPGLDGLRGPVPPRAHLRARGRPGRRPREGDRLRRGDRRAVRDRERRAGEHGPRRRRAAVGVPLLDRAPVAHPVRLHGAVRHQAAAPRERAPAAARGRGSGRSSRSRSPTSPACGASCRSAVCWSCSRGPTRSSRSGRITRGPSATGRRGRSRTGAGR